MLKLTDKKIFTILGWKKLSIWTYEVHLFEKFRVEESELVCFKNVSSFVDT